MSDLSLRRSTATDPALFDLLKEMFHATPLGLLLAALARR